MQDYYQGRIVNLLQKLEDKLKNEMTMKEIVLKADQSVLPRTNEDSSNSDCDDVALENGLDLLDIVNLVDAVSGDTFLMNSTTLTFTTEEQ